MTVMEIKAAYDSLTPADKEQFLTLALGDSASKTIIEQQGERGPLREAIIYAGTLGTKGASGSQGAQ